VAIKEVANRHVELSGKSQYEQAQTELYAENAVSIEPLVRRDCNLQKGLTEDR